MLEPDRRAPARRAEQELPDQTWERHRQTRNEPPTKSAHAGSGTNRTVGGLGGSAPQHNDGRPGELPKATSRVVRSPWA